MTPQWGECKGLSRQSSTRDRVAALEEELRVAVSSRIGASRFALWFGENVRLALNPEGDSLIVRVPNLFFRDWIERHYRPCLMDAIEAIVGRKLSICVKLHGEGEPDSSNIDELGSGSPDLNTQPHVLTDFPTPLPKHFTAARLLIPYSSVANVLPTHLVFNAVEANRFNRGGIEPASTCSRNPELSRPLRQLPDFVTGTSNRVAFAAAIEMSRTAGIVFNPLMIHGGIGLGKTHLLEGINHSLRQCHPSLQVVQLSARHSLIAFSSRMRSGTLNHFRNRLRNAGSLIVDDVQFLAAKRATMIEFLYTFDALHDKGVPIILAADQHPRQIPHLTDELVTRFLAGMIVRIESPDMETRQAILNAKAIAHGIKVPEGVVAYIAGCIRASVRELEGALCTVIAQSVLMGRCLDVALAQSALRDSIRYTSVSIGIRDVEQAVCNLFQIKAEVLRSESRAQALAYPRMIAMYLCRKHTAVPYSQIGRHFGGRNHTTVIAAERKVNRWIESEQRVVVLPGFETVAELLSDLERTLRASGC